LPSTTVQPLSSTPHFNIQWPEQQRGAPTQTSSSSQPQPPSRITPFTTMMNPVMSFWLFMVMAALTFVAALTLVRSRSASIKEAHDRHMARLFNS
jgi:hypothetical protein